MKKLLILFLFLPVIAAAQNRGGQHCPIVPQHAVVNLTNSGDGTIVAADNSRRIFVWQGFIVNSHATTDENITLKEGSTAVSGAYLLKAAGGSHTFICTGTPWAVVPVGSAFIINLSAGTASIQGTVYYTLEQP